MTELPIVTPGLLYWSFAMASAVGFYGGIRWIGGHFRPEFKKELSEWLNGYYESTWASHFGRLFDTAFGEKHISLKRLARSAIASAIAVVVLYVLFAHVLGVLGSRTFESIGLLQALFIGIAVNILPDYLSLIETRWLLEKFAKVHSFFGQLFLLVADLLFTTAIILVGIYIYNFLFGESHTPSPIEIIAIFSVYSIFFYSTFLSTIWAWVYCLSSWFVRLFTKMGLRRVLNISEEPIKQIALIGAAFVFLGGLLLGPLFKTSKVGAATVFDDFICGLDLRACFHAARSSNNTDSTVHYMQLACSSETDDANCAERLDRVFGGKREETNKVWQRACEGGFGRACRTFGYSLEYAVGIERQIGEAATLYRKACDLNDMGGCNNLGTLYDRGFGVEKDMGKAISLYKRACDGNYLTGCVNLGISYGDGWWKGNDSALALKFHSKACDAGHLVGCRYLGEIFSRGIGVKKDSGRGISLYGKACDGGDMESCHDLGHMYNNGEGVKRDREKAIALVQKACNGGYEKACYPSD